MQKSKLIDRLRLIEREELRNFGKFVESPYHNTDEKVVRLFDYLKKYHPVFEHKKLDRDYITEKLFPEWKGNVYKKLSHVMSSLSDRVDDFFILREMEEDELERQQFLLKAYKRRKGDWFFNQVSDTLNKTLDETSEYGINYYLHKYRLNHEIYTHTATERVEKGIESFKNVVANLDAFYFSQKFLYASEIRFRELYYSEKSEILLLEEMLKEAEKATFADKQHVIIFSAIIKLYYTKDKKDYEQLKKLIFEGLHQFSLVEKLDTVMFVNNFCIMEYNQGKEDYLIEVFDLHEYGLHQKLWLVKGYLSNLTYNNIVAIACLLEKYDWTEKFIRDYSKYLREEIRDSLRTMAVCRLEFSMGNYEKILELLRGVEFVDLHHNLAAKSYQLRSYVELGGYDMLFYDACNAFAQYCRRNKTIGKETKETHLNFIKMARRIHQHQYEKKENQKDMMEELNKLPCANAKWLKKKIKEKIN